VSHISENNQETSLSLWSEQSDAADSIILERIAIELGILGEHPAFG
jgi:hypothetical protein